MTTFGSTDEDPIPKEEIEKALGRRDQATLAGVIQEFGIVKQKMDNLHEQMRRLQGVFGNLLSRVEGLEKARVTDLQVRVNGGPTVRED